MKNKIIVIAGLLLILLVIGLVSYVTFSSNIIEKDMMSYLEDKGYNEQDIESIKVRHSYLNILLSYNQWTIYVTFNDEPSITYQYTIRNGNIVPAGVSGDFDNKKDLKHP